MKNVMRIGAFVLFSSLVSMTSYGMEAEFNKAIQDCNKAFPGLARVNEYTKCFNEKWKAIRERGMEGCLAAHKTCMENAKQTQKRKSALVVIRNV